MIEDCFFEPAASSEIVDLAVGASIGYLNLRGFYRAERSQKVTRLAEINEEVRQANIAK